MSIFPPARPNSWFYEKYTGSRTAQKYNGSRIVKRMIVILATPNGIQRNQTATDTALQNH